MWSGAPHCLAVCELSSPPAGPQGEALAGPEAGPGTAPRAGAEDSVTCALGTKENNLERRVQHGAEARFCLSTNLCQGMGVCFLECCDKDPQAGGLKQQTFILSLSGSQKAEIRVSAERVPLEVLKETLFVLLSELPVLGTVLGVPGL